MPHEIIGLVANEPQSGLVAAEETRELAFVVAVVVVVVVRCSDCYLSIELHAMEQAIEVIEITENREHSQT